MRAGTHFALIVHSAAGTAAGAGRVGGSARSGLYRPSHPADLLYSGGVADQQDDLRQEIAGLKQRVARLEEALSQTRTADSAWEPSQTAEIAPPPGESFESRLGSRIFNRIGIVAVLIGVAWFLKIAFDSRWLGSAGKVTAGGAAGLALYIWSERFRRHGYVAFSYSLKAVGAGLLYLSLWAAWSLFQLLTLPEAGAAMTLVAAANGLLAWQRNSEVMAFYAAIGGYLTPLLLSNGQNHEVALFSYLLILDVAALALDFVRPWPRLVLGAFLASALYGIGWTAFYYTEAQFGITLVFAILFLMLFAGVSLGRTGRASADQEPGPGLLVAVAILNAVFGFFGMLYLFGQEGRTWAAFALCLFYFALTRLRRMASLHLLVGTFFFLAAVSFGIYSFWESSGLDVVDRGIYEQISYSAWFMIFGAATLAAGFWRRSAALRWQGLIVLCLSIGKVFLVDMRTLSQGWRVLSFLGLGALLLIVSFVYQKDWLSLRRS
jgi:uncharacterized membrane protein